eukprot:2475953-Pleurochrysis_carterae.AAC.1
MQKRLQPSEKEGHLQMQVHSRCVRRSFRVEQGATRRTCSSKARNVFTRSSSMLLAAAVFAVERVRGVHLLALDAAPVDAQRRQQQHCLAPHPAALARLAARSDVGEDVD